MSSDVSVSFFISVIFGDVVEVVPSDDNGSLHFGGDDDSLQNFASDGDIAGEGTFFINVVAFDGFFGCSESKSHVFVVPDTSGGLFGEKFFAVEEDIVLFLEGSLLLNDERVTWISAMVIAILNILINIF